MTLWRRDEAVLEISNAVPIGYISIASRLVALCNPNIISSFHVHTSTSCDVLLHAGWQQVFNTAQVTMEVALGVIGVASFAIQLTDSIQKLIHLLGLIQDAPQDLQTVLSDLRILFQILNDITIHHQEHAANGAIEAASGLLLGKVTSFTALITKHESGFRSNSRGIRKWTAFKFASKSKTWEDFRTSLNDTKITLMLACQAGS